MDDADCFAVQERLAMGRSKYPGHEWIRFYDDLYEKPDQAFKAFISLICMGSMFSSGKVVYCFGMPLKKFAGDYHAKIAKEFQNIPDSNTLIIIARQDKGSTLYKSAKVLKDKGLAQIDEPLELTSKNVVDWIISKAKALKLTIEKPACKMLADLSDFNPSKIRQELIKLETLAINGEITPRLIGMAGSGRGSVDINDIAQCILRKDGEGAHEYLQRLLDRGEPALKICGYLQDWLNRLAIAEASGCNYEVAKSVISNLMKWEPDAQKDEFGLAKYETVYDPNWGGYSRRTGETVPMVANPKAIWHACREVEEAGRKQGWTIKNMDMMGKLQNKLRHGKDEARLLHGFIGELMA